MGNCNRKEFVDDDDNLGREKLLADMEFLKMKYRAKDPIIEFIEQVVPGGYLKEIAHFREIYKVKKNFKCQRDLFYRIQVLENTRSGRLFNVKTIKKSEMILIGLENFKSIFFNEMKSLDIFKHPNVESLIDVYIDTSKDDMKLYIVTNYTPRQSLLDVINTNIEEKRRFEDREISIMMKILVQTVYKLKSMNIIHRNLSPENIFFLKEGIYYTLSIRNFYFSAIVTSGSQQVRGLTGGLWFMAPEILKELTYDFKVDVWSLGIIFYMLVTLENPYSKFSNKDEIIEALKSGVCFRKFKDLKKLGYNVDALTLIYKMLAEEPNHRIPTEMVMEDKFFEDNEKNFLEKIVFAKFIEYDWKEMEKLQYKIKNMPALHDIIFYIIYNLKDYFIDVEELIYLNEFYKFFDRNNDGQIGINEIEDQLTSDLTIFKIENIKGYVEAMQSVVNTEFRNTVTSGYQRESVSYDFFLVANIILRLFKNKDLDSTIKKVEIMFTELDLDRGGTVSIEEIQAFFKNKYQKNVFDILKAAYKEDLFERTKIKDFNELTEEDIRQLLFYECIKLTPEQEEDIEEKYKKSDIKSEKSDRKTFNKNGSKRRTPFL